MFFLVDKHYNRSVHQGTFQFTPLYGHYGIFCRIHLFPPDSCSVMDFKLMRRSLSTPAEVITQGLRCCFGRSAHRFLVLLDYGHFRGLFVIAFGHGLHMI